MDTKKLLLIKSEKKKGKSKGAKSTNLSQEKLEKYINSGNVKIETIEVGKTSQNKNKKPIIRKVIDIEITKKVTIYKYYPDKNGNYNIPKYQNKAIVYGNCLKTLCTTLNNLVYNSTDAIASFISSITNYGINIAKEMKQLKKVLHALVKKNFKVFIKSMILYYKTGKKNG